MYEIIIFILFMELSKINTYYNRKLNFNQQYNNNDRNPNNNDRNITNNDIFRFYI